MTVQIKWVIETESTCDWTTPDKATQIGMYIGEPGEYRWLADFDASRADLAMFCATQLANMLGTDVDAPDTMRTGLQIKDGYAALGCNVWWHSDYGPQQVRLDKDSADYTNAQKHPQMYSLQKPKFKVIYED